MTLSKDDHLCFRRSRIYRYRKQRRKKEFYFLVPILSLFLVSLFALPHISSSAIEENQISYKLENDNLINYKDLNQPNMQVVHEVIPGETLFGIARKYYNSTEFAQQLVLDNNIQNPNTDLKSGNSLIISNPEIIDIYKVNQGDTIFSITQQYFNREWYTNQVQAINGIKNPNTDIKAGMKILLPLIDSNIEHIVQPGETLYGIILNNFKISIFQELINRYNGIDPTNLKIGMEIKIPNPFYVKENIINKNMVENKYNYHFDTYKVNRGDTIFSITQQYFNREWYTNRVQAINGIKNPNTDLKVGMKILLPLIDSNIEHIVQPGETLYGIILNNFKISTFQEFIVEYNGIDPANLKIGMEIKIPDPFYVKENIIKKNMVENKYNYHIEINKSNNTLSLFNNEKLVCTFKVATGKDVNATPVGTFEIVNKIKDPWYLAKGIPGGDPRNPLGTRWLGLSVPGTTGTEYGIHGTNNPSSIGKYVSLGCIRMNNEDAQWLYDRIPIGTVVVIRN